jgi:hypothetical protein
MKTWVSIFTIVLAVATGAVPSGMCPGCIGPYCAFAHASIDQADQALKSETCGCCAGKTSTQQLGAPRCRCFIFSTVINPEKCSDPACAATACIELPPQPEFGEPSLPPSDTFVFVRPPSEARLYLVVRSILL